MLCRAPESGSNPTAKANASPQSRQPGGPCTHLLLDERRERQIVEEVSEILPHVGIAVLAQALVVETVHLLLEFAAAMADRNDG